MSNTARVNFYHMPESKALKPQAQRRIGQIAAGFIIAAIVYKLILTGAHCPLHVLSLYFAFFVFIPAAYIYGLTGRKLVVAKTTYRIWVFFMIFSGFFLLVKLLESWTLFLIFWVPLSLVTIFLWVGVRGVTRTLEPQTEKKDIDKISGIIMHIFLLLGFYCGTKIVHSAFSHWDLNLSPQLFFLFLLAGGAVGGLFVGAPVGAFGGSLFEAFVYGLPKKAETRKEDKLGPAENENQGT